MVTVAQLRQDLRRRGIAEDVVRALRKQQLLERSLAFKEQDLRNLQAKIDAYEDRDGEAHKGAENGEAHEGAENGEVMEVPVGGTLSTSADPVGGTASTSAAADDQGPTKRAKLHTDEHINPSPLQEKYISKAHKQVKASLESYLVHGKPLATSEFPEKVKPLDDKGLASRLADTITKAFHELVARTITTRTHPGAVESGIEPLDFGRDLLASQSGLAHDQQEDIMGYAWIEHQEVFREYLAELDPEYAKALKYEEELLKRMDEEAEAEKEPEMLGPTAGKGKAIAS